MVEDLPVMSKGGLVIDRQDDDIRTTVPVNEGMEIYMRSSETHKADYRSLEAR